MDHEEPDEETDEIVISDLPEGRRHIDEMVRDGRIRIFDYNQGEEKEWTPRHLEPDKNGLEIKFPTIQGSQIIIGRSSPDKLLDARQEKDLTPTSGNSTYIQILDEAISRAGQTLVFRGKDNSTTILHEGTNPTNIPPEPGDKFSPNTIKRTITPEQALKHPNLTIKLPSDSSSPDAGIKISVSQVSSDEGITAFKINTYQKEPQRSKNS